LAAPIDRLVAPEPLNTLAEKPFAQVNSVSQLSDVKPTDWAFQALQSLVERYGCIVGYHDGTYRGNRAMTRYEFAAGLNTGLTQLAQGEEDFFHHLALDK
jgi:predicted PhzF superfamily epimerase YddE/YHI9